MKKIVALIWILAFSFSSCEKDDICDPNTPTTPSVLIQFYDISNPLAAKNVTNLKVIGEGMTDGIIFNSTATGEEKYLTNGNSILIPLKTNEDSTNYRFILNSGNPNAALINEDILMFKYTRENIYVSSACGFKTVFNLDTNNLPIPIDASTPDGLWMRDLNVIKSNITNENETIIKIFF